MNGKSMSAGVRRGLACASVLSIGTAGFAACGAPAESGTSSVVTHTVTQTVGTASVTQTSTTSVMTGDYTPPIETGTTEPGTTTPPLITTPPPVSTTGTTPSAPDPSPPTLTSAP